jgi:hypothetical protein
MKGLQLLLNSMGVQIDPAQIQEAFERGKDALPKLSAAFDEMTARISRLEGKIDALLAWCQNVDKAVEDAIAEGTVVENDSEHDLRKIMDGKAGHA